MDRLEDEYRDMYDAWRKTPTPQAAGALLRSVQPVLDRSVQQFQKDGYASPTLRSTARRLALDAFQSYDPKRSSLRTHLQSQLRVLPRYANREQSSISIPERVRQDMARLGQSSQDLTDQLGREPSDLELADHTGLSIRRIQHVRQSRLPISGSQAMSPLGDDEASSFEPAVKVTGRSPEWLEFLYGDADARDQLILEHLYGLHGKLKLSPQEIARKLNISPGAVSQPLQFCAQRVDLTL